MTDDVAAAVKALQDFVDNGLHAVVTDTRTVLAELHRLRAAVPVWHPIETASKDGGLVLLYWAGGGEQIVGKFYTGDDWEGWDVNTDQATHWQPLRPPPERGVMGDHPAGKSIAKRRVLDAGCYRLMRSVAPDVKSDTRIPAQKRPYLSHAGSHSRHRSVSSACR